MRPALFLDRDGVINEEVGYVSCSKQIRFVSGIASLIRTANAADWPVIVVTNQAGIGRGLYTEAEFQTVMETMQEELAGAGCRIDAVYFSPFHPEHGLGVYRRDSECRKPRPGMLLKAAEEHNLDLRRSYRIGDRLSDMEAGMGAKVGSLFLFSQARASTMVEESNFSCIRGLHEVEEQLRQAAQRYAAG